MIQAHPTMQRLINAQLAQQTPEERAIAAENDFRRQRILSASHAQGRVLLQWAEQNNVRHQPCFSELAESINNNERIAHKLMACWFEYPACQNIPFTVIN
jgi:hypothetical protein